MMVCRPKESELSNINIKQRNIRMYTLIPIYEEERNLALEKGYDYLLKKMNEKGISDVLNLHRMNAGI